MLKAIAFAVVLGTLVLGFAMVYANTFLYAAAQFPGS